MSNWAKLADAREAGRARRASMRRAGDVGIFDQALAKIRDALDEYGVSVYDERELYLVLVGADVLARYGGHPPMAAPWSALFAILTPYIDEVAP